VLSEVRVEAQPRVVAIASAARIVETRLKLVMVFSNRVARDG
jgi:hypothetical protein